MQQEKKELIEGEISQYTYPMKANEIKEGSFIILQGFTCRVTRLSYTAIPNKYLVKKVIFEGINIFTNKQQKEKFILAKEVIVPHIQNQEYDLINIKDDGEVILLQNNGQIKEDLKIDLQIQQSMFDQIKAAFKDEKKVIITVISAMGKEIIDSFKIIN